MIFLLLLLFPIAEIYVLVRVGSQVGVVNVLFALLAAFVLGSGLARTQGRYIMRGLQASMAQGQVPTDRALHGLLVFLGGILIAMPGFISDVIGVMMVLPGSRHLWVAYFKKSVARKIHSGNFKIFTNVSTGPQPQWRTSETVVDAEWTRDVSPKVIDVTPISSRTEASSPAQESGEGGEDKPKS